MRKCDACDQEYPQDTKFCPECGEKLAMVPSGKPKKGEYKIPYDMSGNMLHYASDAAWAGKPDWRDNAEFEAELEFTGFSRGRSAAYAVFESVPDKRSFPMFLSCLHRAMAKLNGGRLKGRFRGCKKGMNYSVEMVE